MPAPLRHQRGVHQTYGALHTAEAKSRVPLPVESDPRKMEISPRRIITPPRPLPQDRHPNSQGPVAWVQKPSKFTSGSMPITRSDIRYVADAANAAYEIYGALCSLGGYHDDEIIARASEFGLTSNMLRMLSYAAYNRNYMKEHALEGNLAVFRKLGVPADTPQDAAGFMSALQTAIATGRREDAKKLALQMKPFKENAECGNAGTFLLRIFDIFRRQCSVGKNETETIVAEKYGIGPGLLRVFHKAWSYDLNLRLQVALVDGRLGIQAGSRKEQLEFLQSLHDAIERHDHAGAKALVAKLIPTSI